MDTARVEPEPPPEGLAPLLRVFTVWAPEPPREPPLEPPLEPEPDVAFEPLLRVLMTGVADAAGADAAGAIAPVPLERVRVTPIAAALEPAEDALYELVPPGPPEAAT